MVEANCYDLTQYKCDVSEFSPTLTSEIKYYSEESSKCLRYDRQIFDTSVQKQIDEYATAADFEKGGQYNRQEVRCWKQIKNSQPAESTSVKEALKAAYEICK